jgi:hypothetical protein
MCRLTARSEIGITVGPIVSGPFYRAALVGVVADVTSYTELFRFRGPFFKYLCLPSELLTCGTPFPFAPPLRRVIRN